MIEGVPLQKLVEHLLQQAITADAEIQLLQRKGWMDMNQGRPLVEGMDHLEYLGLQELRFDFRLAPIKPGLWERIRRATRYVLGRPEPAATLHVIAPAPGIAGFNVTVTISRRDNRFSAELSRDAESAGDIYVSSLPA